MTDLAVPPVRRRVRNRRLKLAGWLLLGLIAMCAFLGRDEISQVHEERVAATALTMAHSGWPWAARPVRVPRAELSQGADGSHLVAHGDGGKIAVNPWLVPIFEGQIRLQKPPLPYWCAATLDRLLGEGALAARLVPALLGALSGALMYLLARRLGGRRLAMIAVAIWTSSHFVVDEHRKAMADPYLAAIGLAAIVAWVEASARVARRHVLIVAFYGLLGVGAMAKGPVVFAHVGVAIVAFSYCFRRRPRASWIAHVAGALLFAAIALPWPIYVASHVPGALEIWRFESVGEFADNQRNARPFWFYGPQLLLIAAPWTAVAIAGTVVVAARRRRSRAFALLWTVAILVIFSASHMKKNAYLLPLMPALVLLTAGGVRWLMRLARRRPRDVLPWTIGHAIVGVVGAVIVIVGLVRADVPLAAMIAASTLVLLAALWPLRWSLRTDAPVDRWFRAQAFAFAIVVAALVSMPNRSKHRPAVPDADSASATAVRP